MSLTVTVRDLLEAGVHFGHQTARWNPKMKPFIFEQRNGIHIIDLQRTMNDLGGAYDRLKELAGRGHKVLFVGTKKQAKEVVKEAAQRSGMHYVNERWLGGLLTNFVTIRKSVAHYKYIQSIIDDGSINKMPGKEASSMRREHVKLHKNLEGIRDMEGLPSAIFVVDPKREAIAVSEARKIGITVIAIADTNCDPDLLDFPIPGNDDSIRSVKLICDVVADAILDGKKNIVITIKETPPQVPGAEKTAAATTDVSAKDKKPVVKKAKAPAPAKTDVSHKRPPVKKAENPTPPAKAPAHKE